MAPLNLTILHMKDACLRAPFYWLMGVIKCYDAVQAPFFILSCLPKMMSIKEANARKKISSSVHQKNTLDVFQGYSEQNRTAAVILCLCVKIWVEK